MATSLVVNAAAVTGITTTYVKVPLTQYATELGCVPTIPQAGYISNLELNVTQTGAGALSTATVYLTWDTTGDYFASSAGTITLTAGGTASTFGGVLAFDKWYRYPEGVLTGITRGTIYAWIKVNAGTVTVPIDGARLVCTTDYTNQS